MKIKRHTRLAALAAASLLAGCDDVILGNDPMNGCTPITGGGTAHSQSISTGCANCAITNPERVMDGDGVARRRLFTTAQGYNAVEVRITQGTGGAGIGLRAHEFCAN